jgi:hypothetical protein
MSDVNKLDFPKTFSADIEFQVFIPSTRHKTIPIGAAAFRKRIDGALKFFSIKFGGSTVAYDVGTYIINWMLLLKDGLRERKILGVRIQWDLTIKVKWYLCEAMK